MSPKKLKTIGILGGMGPEAGAHFFGRIVAACAARRDQDHPPVVLFSLPQVPDRTEAILHGGRSPVPALLRGLRVLHRAGADFAVIPCVSAHSFLPRIAPRSPLPVLSLVEASLAAVKGMRPVPRTIGLIGTTGTIRSRIVADAFEAAGIAVVVPPARDQARVMAAIYGRRGIKAGYASGAPRKALLEAAQRLIRRGAAAILAGCTEVPLALRPADLPVPLVDPLEVVAHEAVRRSGAPVR